MPEAAIRIELVGAGGEPVDLERTIYSHGVAGLPPMRAEEGAAALEVTLGLRTSKPRTVRIERDGRRRALISVFGREPGEKSKTEIVQQVLHILRMDEDLSAFYEMCTTDDELAWAAHGSGRMIRSQSVFEEVVKTICTTNCAWSATERMVAAIVGELGEPAMGDRRPAPYGRAFPTPEAMASVGEDFYRDVARAGYRARYFHDLASRVAAGDLDLEAGASAGHDELPDDELFKLLLALPGVGPYAATHVMMMMGRYSRLILDSWTRPTYAALVGRKQVKDSTIERRFRRYGRYAGLAFWLFLTRRWLDDPGESSGVTG